MDFVLFCFVFPWNSIGSLCPWEYSVSPSLLNLLAHSCSQYSLIVPSYSLSVILPSLYLYLFIYKVEIKFCLSRLNQMISWTSLSSWLLNFLWTWEEGEALITFGMWSIFLLHSTFLSCPTSKIKASGNQLWNAPKEAESHCWYRVLPYLNSPSLEKSDGSHPAGDKLQSAWWG